MDVWHRESSVYQWKDKRIYQPEPAESDEVAGSGKFADGENEQVLIGGRKMPTVVHGDVSVIDMGETEQESAVLRKEVSSMGRLAESGAGSTDFKIITPCSGESGVEGNCGKSIEVKGEPYRASAKRRIEGISWDCGPRRCGCLSRKR